MTRSARVRDADDALNAVRQPRQARDFDLTDESRSAYRLADTADVVVIAPATANVIAKMATGSRATC
jgi:phosphopantothenoylcysteine synthetase/decarboxylase